MAELSCAGTLMGEMMSAAKNTAPTLAVVAMCRSLPRADGVLDGLRHRHRTGPAPAGAGQLVRVIDVAERSIIF
jgi:hypothetical protein